MATKKNKKSVDLNIAAAMDQAVSMGVLEAKTSLECESVPAPEHVDAAPFEEILDRMIMGADVLPIQTQEEQEDFSFEKMRKRVSNVPKYERPLFDQFLAGNLKVTEQNSVKPKAVVTSFPVQDGFMIVGNSTKELRQAVASHVKEYGAPKKAILAGNFFVFNDSVMNLSTSERPIDISKSGGIVGKKYINFTDTVDGREVKFAIQPELQSTVSILLLYIA